MSIFHLQQARWAIEDAIREVSGTHYGGRRLLLDAAAQAEDAERADLIAAERRLLELARRAVSRNKRPRRAL